MHIKMMEINKGHNSDMSDKKVATVIGGGVAGCGAALQLAKKGWKVTIYEKNKLLSGTSCKTPGRMGLGFHYIDFETSVMLIKATIRFAKTFPGFCFEEDFPREHPIRRGRYFITKDSMFAPTEILHHYHNLKAEYERLVTEDPSNMVFGPPEDFFRILSPEEYEEHVTMGTVAVGVETAEHLLNWSQFERHLLEVIKREDNISVEEHAEAVSVKQTNDKNTGRFIIKFKIKFDCGQKEKIVVTNYVVNSTWSEIEKINTMAGFHSIPGSRTNRLKAILKVELPDCLRNANSMFFCMGPFCMFSNHGNGQAQMMYAPVTNVEMCEDVNMSRRMIKLLVDGPSEEESNLLTEGILQGVSRFIPAMKQAKLKELGFGIVQTHGKVDLYDVNSSIHKRAYFGVREEARGWVSNPCMKLLYMLENADIVTDILEEHYQLDTI